MIICSLINGSKLYGLHNEKSDLDLINIYVKDRKDYYLKNPNKSFRRKIGNYDILYIDLLTFCRHAVNCNPNFFIPLLEGKTLYYDHPRGIILFNYSFAFFDHENIQKAFTGFINYLINKNTEKDHKTAEYIRNYRDYLISETSPQTKTNYPAIEKMIDEILTYKPKGEKNNSI